jgi:uncharacterized protein YbaA (DUF1428 family)
MYISCYVIPVPEEKLDAYRAWAKGSAALMKEFGCLEIVDSIGDIIPRGKQTDFRRAVDAKEGEKIAMVWQVWADKASMLAAEERLHESGRLDAPGEPPFDARRLIVGCFDPIATLGRE